MDANPKTLVWKSIKACRLWIWIHHQGKKYVIIHSVTVIQKKTLADKWVWTMFLLHLNNILSTTNAEFLYWFQIRSFIQSSRYISLFSPQLAMNTVTTSHCLFYQHKCIVLLSWGQSRVWKQKEEEKEES